MKMFGVLIGVTLLSSAGVAIAADTAKPPKQTDRSAPDYVRCVKDLETGSLVKKNKICRTNAEWCQVSRDQTQDATDLVERSRAGMVSN